jgi:hypothetical protein
MSTPAPVPVGATHLYPGLRLAVPRAASEEPGLRAGLRLEFSDGAAAAAELVRDIDDRLALRVDGYRTAAGTRLPEKLWPVRAHHVAGRQLQLVLGRAFPAATPAR